MPTSPAAAPSVRLDFTNPPMVVTFDFLTLETIETAMGEPVNELAFGRMAELAPKSDSVADQIASVRKIRVGFVVSFVAACLRTDRDGLREIVPNDRISDAFLKLAMCFCDAVKVFNGISLQQQEQEQATDPQMPTAIEPAAVKASTGPDSGDSVHG